MRRTRPGRVLGGVLLLALTAACATGPGDTGTPAPEPAPLPAGLVLQVAHTGGYTTPEELATRLPVVTVYGDGRVLTPGPQIAIWPAPALPNVQVQQVDAGTVRELVEQAVAAGVTGSGDLGQPPLADATTTRFTLVTDEGTAVREVYALAETPDDTVTPEQAGARGRLRDLVDALTGLPASGEPYVPQTVAAVVQPHTGGDPELPQPDVAWPGPALPGASVGAGLTCVSATGQQAADVLAAAATANALTPWVTPDGGRWSIALRPVLPHESGCTDLG
ncbi:hypothetical protein SAMN05660690_0188 [Geodermatophilus telluris]|uniref:Sporulation and spore germination n=1 Tax=Geodermatophilus telluris TaxID=1190417 RepID=A0A1G6I487_9ACTN|nr:hypothetical protein [Geodermatophilus telluris]SDC01379.1 hypothetical protein SAMN05660690_0188 [Geodermatophilus telluris]